ncbi:MAG: DNA primase small subunit PriS [Candidatus Methanofastidiosum methylothiophilum]|uniref:DNA primase small subunit PriS n=1 Tax=Candidatus Methanofastidiosum methylothiophilum TaxID=1705564 RepID=A0A150ITU6_9EURY|nr:MAG: DNA primase small subunit PriS [Candidatus Methanofastidiosum methylthiophilus]KYC48362.1 MAG: DNA primase small subunit PriS [Candidatus Methanofastidiosum methylthiophilus]KYC50773.1 MAG: DNA primase small subunit PriS [Candidatus Methanofastidiosum methylthiophilus]
MDFREASLRERKLYYHEEWNERDVPEFIIERIMEREFAFDHDGKGYNDRYKGFDTLSQFSDFLIKNFPYAVCTSVSYYSKPKNREDWKGAELVFDIDAKDLVVKTCECKEGNVCEKCLSEAKEIVLKIKDTLIGDLGVKRLYLVYSGRGYHLRVVDNDVLPLERRSEVLEYVTGSKRPKDLFLSHGYPAVYRKMFILTFNKMNEKDLPFSKNIIDLILSEKKTIISKLKTRHFDFLDIKGIGDKTKNDLLGHIEKINGSLVDGKVTVDVKRILRLPSTLHSKVSMKCVEIKNIENFDPLKQAVPKFVSERKD